MEPRMVIMASPRDLDVLFDTTDVVLDGTFDYHPREFNSGWAVCQMYSLHAFVNSEAVPVVVALLSNKTKETYQQLFRVLRVSPIHLLIIMYSMKL